MSIWIERSVFQRSEGKAAGPLSSKLATLPAVLCQQGQQTRFFCPSSGDGCLHSIEARSSSPYIESKSVYVSFMIYEEDDGGRSLLQRELKLRGSKDTTRQDPRGSGRGGVDPLGAGRRRGLWQQSSHILYDPVRATNCCSDLTLQAGSFVKSRRRNCCPLLEVPSKPPLLMQTGTIPIRNLCHERCALMELRLKVPDHY